MHRTPGPEQYARGGAGGYNTGETSSVSGGSSGSGGGSPAPPTSRTLPSVGGASGGGARRSLTGAPSGDTRGDTRVTATGGGSSRSLPTGTSAASGGGGGARRMSTGTGGGGSGSAGAGAGSSGSPAPRAVRPSSGRSPSPFFGRSSSFTKLGVGSAEGPVLPFQSVGEMLASLELEQYAQALDAEGFDSVPRLLMLEEADLDALQVSAQACAFFFVSQASVPMYMHTLYLPTHSVSHSRMHDVLRACVCPPFAIASTHRALRTGDLSLGHTLVTSPSDGMLSCSPALCFLLIDAIFLTATHEAGPQEAPPHRYRRAKTTRERG